MNAFQQGIREIDGSTHDDQRYVNALGPRGVIGVMTPGPNVNVENEMMDMRPRGVINAIDRYYVPNQKIAQDEDWSIISVDGQDFGGSLNALSTHMTTRPAIEVLALKAKG